MLSLFFLNSRLNWIAFLVISALFVVIIFVVIVEWQLIAFLFFIEFFHHPDAALTVLWAGEGLCLFGFISYESTATYKHQQSYTQYISKCITVACICVCNFRLQRSKSVLFLFPPSLKTRKYLSLAQVPSTIFKLNLVSLIIS